MSDSYAQIYSDEQVRQYRRDKQMADAAGVSPAQIRLLRTQGRLIQFLSRVAEQEIMAMEARYEDH